MVELILNKGRKKQRVLLLLYCQKQSIFPRHALFIPIFCKQKHSEHVEMEYIIKRAQLILIISEAARIVANDN